MDKKRRESRKQNRGAAGWGFCGMSQTFFKERQCKCGVLIGCNVLCHVTDLDAEDAALGRRQCSFDRLLARRVTQRQRQRNLQTATHHVITTRRRTLIFDCRDYCDFSHIWPLSSSTSFSNKQTTLFGCSAVVGRQWGLRSFTKHRQRQDSKATSLQASAQPKQIPLLRRI